MLLSTEPGVSQQGAPPLNDDFAHRIVISGSFATNTGSNVGATSQSGEPLHAGIAGARSVWWAWTAPAAETVVISTAGSDFDTLLAVYTGNTLNRLTIVTNNNDSSGHTSRVSFEAIPQATYQIAVDGVDGASGRIVLRLGSFARPTNDDFDSRIALSGSSVHTAGWNVRASSEFGEPMHAYFAAARSVWWTWTAPFTGRVEISTEGSDFDTLLAVYTGSTLPLTAISSNDDYSYGGTSRVAFNTLGGVTYSIAVDGFDGAFGSIVLSLSLSPPPPPPPPPPNDDFADRAQLTGESVLVTGSNAGGTRESGEPNGIGPQSVWWTWTAPRAGTVELSVFPDNGRIALFTGSAFPLSLVAASLATNTLIFDVAGGETYQIAVSGNGAFSLQLTLQQFPQPVNDDFSNRIALVGSSITITGDNRGATREAGEPIVADAQNGKSVWWSWTAPESGTLVVSTMRSSLPLVVGVFTGTAFPLTNIVPRTIATPFYGETNIVFDVVSGHEYHILVDGTIGRSGLIILTCQFFQQRPLNDDFANRANLSGTAIHLVGHNIGATSETGEPSAYKSVWWSWTAPGTYLVDSSVLLDYSVGACPFFVIDVYTSDAFPLVPVPSVGLGKANTTSCRKLFVARAGETFAFVVGGIEGVFPFELACYPLAPNDDFTNATALTGSRITGTSYNVFAGRETGEPDHGGLLARHSLWWSWTAPAVSGTGSRPVTFTTFPSDFSSLLAVYTGDALTNLTLIADSTGARPGLPFGEVTFRPSPQTTYHVAIDSAASNNVGYVSLSVDYSPIDAIISELEITSNFTSQTVFFRASLNITNYGATTPGPLRARLLRHAHDVCSFKAGHPRFSEELERYFLPPLESFSGGSGVSIPIRGTCPRPVLPTGFNALFVVIEEEHSGVWLSVDQVFVLLGFRIPDFCNPDAFSIGVLRAANVVEGRSGQIEVADLAIVSPSVITAGKTASVSVLALMTGNAPPALVADPSWRIPPILSIRTNTPGTNFVLTAGTVCARTNVTISCTFKFLESEFEAVTNISVIPPYTLRAEPLRSSGTIRLHVTGESSARYILEFADSLDFSHAWTPVWTNGLSSECAWMVDRPIETANRQRFYRVRRSPE